MSAATSWNKAFEKICACRRDKTLGVIVWFHPDCILHGKDSSEKKHRLELEKAVDHWRRAKNSAQTETVTWYRRHKNATQQLTQAEQKLKEMGQ